MNENSYDLIPYASYPFRQTHPDNLYTIASLFGIGPAQVEDARILELGCASGGNIIPMALLMPRTQIVGVDFSKKQIDEGREEVKRLNLTNIELKHNSILDIDKSWGTFDYIICHGVFSWVPSEVREKILAVCSENLTPNGVACISYNTFPGWNFVRSFREMMIYHTNSFDSLEEKADQARALLQFIYDGVKEGTSPYAAFLKSEIGLLSEKSDAYLIHEHLEENNQPYYFHEFVDSAQKAGLRYLADSPLAIMFHYNFPDQVIKELDKVNDLIRMGQYMDYFRNQRFRTSLLCRNEVNISRKLRPSDMERYCFSFNGSFKKEKDFEKRMHEGVKLAITNKWATLTLTGARSKSILMVLLENKKKPVSYHDLALETQKRCGFESLEQAKEYINEEFGLLRLVLSGLVDIHRWSGGFTNKIEEKPAAFSLAAFQAREKEIVTNMRHEIVRLDIFERVLIQHLKGEKDRERLYRVMCEHAYKDELSIVDNKTGKKLESKEEIDKNIKVLLDNSLERFVSHGLLAEKQL